MIYLDSAAIVKLAHAEGKSQALRDWLDERAESGWVSSALAEVESFRALARNAPAAIARLAAVLDLIDLVEIDAQVRTAAQAVQPAVVRSLDAIHLATALRLGHQLGSFVTYDKRLASAAAAAGLPVAIPSDSPAQPAP
ncbi:MAG: type II toxin-antitoxin system VapC family toxin [Streptosporangiaceae bacterium]